MSEPLRRHSDYADMPRQYVWIIVAIREIGLPAAVIGALLYFTYVGQEKMTETLKQVTIGIATIHNDQRNIIDNQKVIIDRLK